MWTFPECMYRELIETRLFHFLKKITFSFYYKMWVVLLIQKMPPLHYVLYVISSTLMFSC